MDLQTQQMHINTLREKFYVQLDSYDDTVIALAGNPNTGKSTIFNNLTGLKQHTGNWPGKTVTNAQGKYKYDDKNYVLVDLPGTYSLYSNSVDEEVARDFISFGNAHAIVVVTDATSLERNLNLVLQVLEITDKVVVCVNMIDEASRKKISIDTNKLSILLGVPVVETCGKNKKHLEYLKSITAKVVSGDIKTTPTRIKYNELIEESIEKLDLFISKFSLNNINSKWISLRLIDEDINFLNSISDYLEEDLNNNAEFKEILGDIRNECNTKNITPVNIRYNIVQNIVKEAESITKQVVTFKKNNHNKSDIRLDSILTSKIWGIPIMIMLLGLIFWLTIKGANIPSEMIAKVLFAFETKLTYLFHWMGTPEWVHGIFVLGMYRTTAWVTSVMLPPMAIFFPLFTLLEDFGYLPRIAFNLDNFFKKACTHGKQALTMCMGFGCNAAGVISCRIIDSPRERLIAIITNNFVPCNGRFPTLIILSSILVLGTSGLFASLKATLAILFSIILGIFITLLISKLLSKTILKGLPSSFILEMPPYRKPQVLKVIIRSIFDRTLFVLGRAIAIAAPAGLVIWLMANITFGDISILVHCANFLDPFAQLIGLDGYILLAFILGLPANEIVIPILIASYMSKGSLINFDNLQQLQQLFINNGWTWLTVVCTMLFSLNHWPCGTTLWTIKKETLSYKWTFISFIVPTITGIILCFIVAQCSRLLGLI